MVDVGNKDASRRTATAEATVMLGETVMTVLREGGFATKKGSVTQTAIIAATMAVKQTWAIIPLCHPLPIMGCEVTVEPLMDDRLQVRCTVRTEGKTGVEMEALHGASVAALTIYDMCKALSPAIEITHLRLLRKRGGKTDYDRE
jgi:cyclic pyranopterin phosphate synthase